MCRRRHNKLTMGLYHTNIVNAHIQTTPQQNSVDTKQKIYVHQH